MIRTFLLISMAVVALATLVSATDPAQTLSAYEKEAKIVSLGMCDNMQTSISRYRGKKFKEMDMVAPVSQDRFYVITKQDNKQEFFVKHIGTEPAVVEQKPNAMMWSVGLMQQSPNYFHYHFHLQPNDCGETKVPPSVSSHR